MNFCFECLDKYSSRASHLFNYVDFQTAGEECLNKIYEKYKNKINFQLLNNDILLYTAFIYKQGSQNDENQYIKSSLPQIKNKTTLLFKIQ